MRGVWLLTRDNPADLLQLFDEMKFGVQPSRGVDEDHIGPPAFGSLKSVENHGRGVSAGTMFNDLDAHFFSPSFKLFDGCCAEGITRDEEHLLAAAAQLSGHFTDGGGLAGSIHSQKKNYPRSHR